MSTLRILLCVENFAESGTGVILGGRGACGSCAVGSGAIFFSSSHHPSSDLSSPPKMVSNGLITDSADGVIFDTMGCGRGGFGADMLDVRKSYIL